MKELDLKVGFQCNNACVFCLNKDKRRYQEFPLETFKKEIEFFAQKGGERLVISGGEPLISKYFFDLITFAKQRGIKFLQIQTNGRMLFYEELIRKIKEFEPIDFLVSLHFPNYKLYKKFSQSDGFYQTIKGIENLVKHNLNFTVNTVIMKPNLPYLKRLIKLLKRIGVKKYQYRFIDGKNVINNYKEFVPRYSECLPIIKKIIKENQDLYITLREIPICVLGEEFKNSPAPCLSPERLNLTTNYSIVTTEQIEAAQFTFPNCEGCLWRSSCSGVRKEYVQFYGIEELNPVRF